MGRHWAYEHTVMVTSPKARLISMYFGKLHYMLYIWRVTYLRSHRKLLTEMKFELRTQDSQPQFFDSSYNVLTWILVNVEGRNIWGGSSAQGKAPAFPFYQSNGRIDFLIYSPFVYITS
jgi:hypothetical protein